MTHYEERLERDLQEIRRRTAEVSERVVGAVEEAVHALLHRDRDKAARVILGDHPVNRATRRIDRLCHLFVARHLPAAGVLRLISSTMRLTVELERVGDYAVAIAREAVQLREPVPPGTAANIEMLADHALRVLRRSLQAFQEGNAELARGTKGLASAWRRTFDKMYNDLVAEGEQGARPLPDLFALLFAFIRLVRISDQAKNICEETIFAATGETKQPKLYRILFVDARNDALSLMAEAVARKAYPESGAYASAGWDPAPAPDASMLAFLDERGHRTADLHPSPLPDRPEELAEYHVIVGLEGDPAPHLVEIPFHTVVVHWEMPAPDDAGGLDALYKDLSLRIRELMEILRGDETG